MLTHTSNDAKAPSRAEAVAALLISCLASLSIFAMPFIFSALIESHGLDLRKATFATSAEISMIALGSIFVSFALKNISSRKTTLFAVLIVCIGQLATVYLDGYSELILSRAVVGLGEGLSMGIGFSCLAQMSNGTRMLSLCTGIVAALSLISFIMIPMLQPVTGHASVFWVLLVFAVLSLPLAPFVPKFKLTADSAKLELKRGLSPEGVALFIIGVLASSGSNTLWLYFEQIGASVGLSMGEVGQLGSLSSVPTLLVPFAANWVFSRCKSVLPLIVVSIVAGTASYYYIVMTSGVLFAVIVTVLMFLYIFLLAFLRMYSAYIDPTGRTTAAVGGADSVGMVAGPLVAAFTLNLSVNLNSLAMFGFVMQVACVIPCLLIIAKGYFSAKHRVTT